MRSRDHSAHIDTRTTCARTCIHAARPFPPPCQAGSWTCPGEDTPYDTTKVLFAGNFGDGMVLQRGPGKAAVYGTATPSAAVKLVLAAPGTHAASATSAVTVTTTTNVGGSWKVLLPPQSAGTGYTVTATCTGCTNSSAVASASDVAFGDVWMCSGQSNMEVTLRNTFSRNESYAEADAGKYNNIRLFQTWWRANKQPEYILPHFKPSNVQSQAAAVNWTAPTSKTLPTFSAACWYEGNQPTLPRPPKKKKSFLLFILRLRQNINHNDGNFRDVPFSLGKRPEKTNCGIFVWQGTFNIHVYFYII